MDSSLKAALDNLNADLVCKSQLNIMKKNLKAMRAVEESVESIEE